MNLKTISRIASGLIAVIFAGSLYTNMQKAHADDSIQKIFDQMQGSKHDFSRIALEMGSRGCEVCHTLPDDDGQIKWNRKSTSERFTRYNSPTLDSRVDRQPAESSRQCLDCHAGDIPVDNYGDITGGTWYIYGSAQIGKNGHLVGDHPISMKYDERIDRERGLNPKSRVELQVPLPDGKVECVSCHDIKNPVNKYYLRRADNDDLCRVCHNL